MVNPFHDVFWVNAVKIDSLVTAAQTIESCVGIIDTIGVPTILRQNEPSLFCSEAEESQELGDTVRDGPLVDLVCSMFCRR